MNRLRALREARRMTLDQVADAAGMSKQYLSRLERDERRLNQTQMERLARALGVQPHQLLIQRGSDFPWTAAEETAMRQLEQNPDVRSWRKPSNNNADLIADIDGREVAVEVKSYRVPELNVRAAAGAGAWPDLMTATGTWQLPADVVRAYTTAPEAALRVITVYGDSMEPTLMAGQRVLVDTQDRRPSPPGLFVVWDGFGLVAKRVEALPHSDPATVSLTSDNPRYRSYERTLDEAHLQGRIVGLWRWT